MRFRFLSVLLLCLLVLVQGFLFVALVPPWMGPDEPQHFQYAALVAERGMAVTLAEVSPALENEVVESMLAWDFLRRGMVFGAYDPANPPTRFEQLWPGDHAHQLRQPPAYYALAASVLKVISSQDIEIQLYALRGVSLLLGMLAVVAAWATLNQLLPDQPEYAVAISAIFILQPQVVFMFSIANNDALAILTGTIWAGASVILLRRGWRPLPILFILAALACSLLAKRTALYLIPLTLIALWMSRSPRVFRRALFKWLAAGGFAALALLVLFWPRFRAYLFLPNAMAEHLLQGDYSAALLEMPYAEIFSVLFRSYWGLFGWLNVSLPASVYFFFLIFMCIGLFGLFQWRRRTPDALAIWQWRTLALWALGLPVAVLAILGKELLYLNYLGGGLPQGRYLFALALPFTALLALGFLGFLRPGHRRYALGLLVALFFILDVYVLGFLIPDFYYGGNWGS